MDVVQATTAEVEGQEGGKRPLQPPPHMQTLNPWNTCIGSVVDYCITVSLIPIHLKTKVFLETIIMIHFKAKV